MSEPIEQPILIPFPTESGDAPELRIGMGPGQLRIAPAEGGDWVTGTYRDPTGVIPIKVETNGARARIAQSASRSLPKLKGAPRLELQLGAERAYALVIEGGANEVDAELGGLPLLRLECKFGAGQARFRFSAPNPAAMERLAVSSGAAEATFAGLANANAAELSVEGGAAAFHLDFGGDLRQDLRARLNVGVAGVDITVPGGTAARIRAKTTLGRVDAGDGFVTKEGGYWTLAAANGQTPVVTIEATVALANVKLRTSEPSLRRLP